MEAESVASPARIWPAPGAKPPPSSSHSLSAVLPHGSARLGSDTHTHTHTEQLGHGMETEGSQSSLSTVDSPHDPCKMFIGGLSWQTTQDGLKEYFCKYGEVKECMVMRDPVTKRSRGFGFVTFVDQAGVDKVLAQTRHELDSKTVRLHPLKVHLHPLKVHLHPLKVHLHPLKVHLHEETVTKRQKVTKWWKLFEVFCSAPCVTVLRAFLSSYLCLSLWQMEPDEGRCTFIQQRLERRCTLTRRKVQHLLSLCWMKVHLKVQLLLSLCRMKVHLKVQLLLSICRMKLKNSSVTEEKDNKAHHLQSFLGIPEIINKCPLSCEFRGLSGGPAVSGLSEHPQGLDGYPGFQTATYTSRSYAGITPGYTYQFPEFHLERTPLLTSPHPPELTAIPLTAYGPMAAAAAAAAVVRGSTPSRSAGFLGTSSPGPMADLYGTASQESAVNSYLSAASPAPSTGFSHSLGGPLIATAFTNGYH
ncbi:RNA-binding protein Musashi-like protein 1 [Larimichthys crocea]|uniref:Uncharacterized protein n=1 Tax=Larimichthys crocea TaxID=215358 RepID=A0ACD3QAG2_LARCR|nr:RNA-binding protein Musashi-like protein 1 [Larimichthys crocea]